MEAALREEGLEEWQLRDSRPRLKVWSLSEGNIVRFFAPQAIRRPWGFRYSGAIGIEIPELRQWLRTHKPGDGSGIFHTCFVSYHIANDDLLGDFGAEHGQPIPADLWAGMLRDRLAEIPPTLDEIISVYRGPRENLGWLAHPYERHAWDFLLKWHADPDPGMNVPYRLPTGHIVS